MRKYNSCAASPEKTKPRKTKKSNKKSTGSSPKKRNSFLPEHKSEDKRGNSRSIYKMPTHEFTAYEIAPQIKKPSSEDDDEISPYPTRSTHVSHLNNINQQPQFNRNQALNGISNYGNSGGAVYKPKHQMKRDMTYNQLDDHSLLLQGTGIIEDHHAGKEFYEKVSQNCSILDQYVQKEREELERQFNGSMTSDPS